MMTLSHPVRGAWIEIAQLGDGNVTNVVVASRKGCVD